MTDFKLGDRVRLNEPYGGYARGHAGTITATHGSTLYSVKFDGAIEHKGVYGRRLDPLREDTARTKVSAVLDAFDTLISERDKARAELATRDKRIESWRALDRERLETIRDLERQRRSMRALEVERVAQVESQAGSIRRLQSEAQTNLDTIRDFRAQLQDSSRTILQLRDQLDTQASTIRELQAAIDANDRAKANSTIRVDDLVHIVGRTDGSSVGMITRQTYRVLEVQNGRPSLVRFTGYDGKTHGEDPNYDGITSRGWVQRYTWEKVSMS